MSRHSSTLNKFTEKKLMYNIYQNLTQPLTHNISEISYNYFAKNSMCDDYFNKNATFLNKSIHSDNFDESFYGIKKEEFHSNSNFILKKEYSDIEMEYKAAEFKANQERIQNTDKKNLKNTYIKKISQLTVDKQKNNQENNSTLVTSQSSKDFGSIYDPNKLKKNQSFGNFDNKEKKLEKNRESARNSRKRKKVYIEMLENKVKQLTEQLNNHKNHVEENKLSLIKIQDCKNKEISINQHHLLSEIQIKINQNENDANIVELLQKFHLFTEIDSHEKTQSIEFFLEQILEIMIPIHMRYLMWVSTNGRDIFESEMMNLNIKRKNNNNWDEILKNLELNDKSTKDMLKYKKRLAIEKEKFGKIITALFDWRNKMKKHTGSVKETMEEMKNVLDLRQISHFLLDLEKFKEKNQNLCNLWELETFQNFDSDKSIDQERENFQIFDQSHPNKKVHKQSIDSINLSKSTI